jgi:hypothetical protein
MRSHRARICRFVLLVTLSFALAPAGAQAAISLVAASSAATTGGGAVSLAITKPTGVGSGNVMIAVLTATGSGALTPPAGWTVIQDTTQGAAIRQITYYRVAGSSEPASYSWSLGSTRQASGGIIAYSGVNTAAPIDASASASAASGNAGASSVTTSAANDKVIVASGFNINTTVTAPAGTTQRYTMSSPSTTGEAADFTQASAGATGTKTATPANSSAAWIAQTIALRDTAQAALTVGTTAVPSFSANLNSGDQTPTYTTPLTVNDTRTTGSIGWNLTLTSTQFNTGTSTLATNASTVTSVTASCANGGVCANPTNSLTYPINVPAGSSPPTPNKFYNAASATGVGTFTVTPTIQVSVPQNSYAGSYTSTLTIAIASGP